MSISKHLEGCSGAYVPSLRPSVRPSKHISFFIQSFEANIHEGKTKSMLVKKAPDHRRAQRALRSSGPKSHKDPIKFEHIQRKIISASPELPPPVSHNDQQSTAYPAKLSVAPLTLSRQPELPPACLSCLPLRFAC